MKFSSEAKIGLIGIVTLAILIWGINFLKGRNFLSSSYILNTSFYNASGLESSSPVLMHGVKIGFVKDIELIQTDSIPIKVKLSIENTYPIPIGSQATLISADLLGTKAIRIDGSGENVYLSDNGHIQSGVESDMLSSLQSQFSPLVLKIGKLAVSLDSLTLGLSQLIGSETTKETLKQLSSISGSLKASLDPGGSLHSSFNNLESFTKMLETQEDELISLTGHFNSISASVDSAGIKDLALELHAVTQQFNHLLEKINAGEGNAGKFFHEDSLYLNLDKLIVDLDELIKDLNENPEDYVHISLFGNSQKKKQ